MRPAKTIKFICSECGCTYDLPSNGMCPYGHDNWMEINDIGGILPYQAEIFEREVGLPVSVAVRALGGDKSAIKELHNAHKAWVKRDKKRE